MLYKGTKSALSRRAFVGRLAAGAAAACAAGAGAVHAKTTQAEPAADPLAAAASPRGGTVAAPVAVAPVAPAPWEILRPLKVGSTVGHGWTVADLSGAADGSCVLTLRNQRGREQRVHICRNDGSPQGIIFTKRFDLLVMNGGAGELETEEGLAQAVAEVAHALAANEGGLKEVVENLLPQSERLARFATAASAR